jgi:hypothetical protein
MSHRDNPVFSNTDSSFCFISFTYRGSVFVGNSWVYSDDLSHMEPNRSSSKSPTSFGGRNLTLGRQEIKTLIDH